MWCDHWLIDLELIVKKNRQKMADKDEVEDQNDDYEEKVSRAIRSGKLNMIFSFLHRLIDQVRERDSKTISIKENHQENS